ncbi:hypothetical protein K493DRAFT_295580 [Basidiobolus meristosporus CBS 931.73]|uniref:G-protein coupled receptors family 1 profile domain-containing protein n=1 Tax=Basidiobolus meristosporus CBS 931.73 TaxID=1314790 RepID=A0A1Y1ZAI3_9FUNG|nr:hypothetical protein K493DRAFT_295580 [Basidiobolus meristosporus CBS 931.73]|eukprot:ORY07186.1 hypothetical protein K493DRAFT_295580 [Basidiobolus meristosporus CBS 931.73]
MSCQLLFGSIRNISVMLLCVGFPISCRLVGIIGGIDYQFFAIATEAVMYIRCRSFTNHRKLLTILLTPTWIIRFALCIWLTTTIQGADNGYGEVCNLVMNYELSAMMQYIKIASELLILAFFIEHLVKLVRRGAPTKLSSSKRWKHLLINNCIFTGLIAFSEVLVAQITVYMTSYLYLAYSLVNLVQSLLLIFIVEDTRKIFVESSSVANAESVSCQPDHYSQSLTRPDATIRVENRLSQGKPEITEAEPWQYNIYAKNPYEDNLP